MYLILAVAYFIIWLFVQGFESLGLAVGNDPYGNKIMIQTTAGENFLAFITFLLPASLFFILFALIKSSKSMLIKARLISKLLTFGIPVFIFIIMTILFLLDKERELRGLASVFTGVWLVLVFAPLWLLNLFGGRDISKTIGDFQKINP